MLIAHAVWAIPAGGVDAGETAAVAAKRELLEETGYTAAKWRTFLTYFPTCGSSDQRFEIFLVHGLTQVNERFDRNKVMEVRWFGAVEAAQMVDDCEIVDGLSLTPILLAMCKGCL
ncbi:NUDIX domain-containing protein [Chromobacterium sphagni]|uniref:NUDIX domain-containing protein n=1 Tax=Chromobacterium sphagni TaxID=1903179 RepID=UPI0009F46D87|nr:NUDIX hydrolase [Chromobacterium sphagni]